MSKGGVERAVYLLPYLVHSNYVSTKQQEDLSSGVQLRDVFCYFDEVRLIGVGISARLSGKLLHSISGGRGIVTFPLSASTIKSSALLPNVSTVPEHVLSR